MNTHCADIWIMKSGQLHSHNKLNYLNLANRYCSDRFLPDRYITVLNKSVAVSITDINHFFPWQTLVMATFSTFSNIFLLLIFSKFGSNHHHYRCCSWHHSGVRNLLLLLLLPQISPAFRKVPMLSK